MYSEDFCTKHQKIIWNYFIPISSKPEWHLLLGAKWKPNEFAMAMFEFPVALVTNFHIDRFSPYLNSQQHWGINQDVKTGICQDPFLQRALVTWTSFPETWWCCEKNGLNTKALLLLSENTGDTEHHSSKCW